MSFNIVENQINGSNEVYFIGEVGINHNGDLDLAKKIILEAKRSSILCSKVPKKKSRTFNS